MQMLKRKCRCTALTINFFYLHFFPRARYRPVQQRIYGMSMMIIMSHDKGRFCEKKKKPITQGRDNTPRLVRTQRHFVLFSTRKQSIGEPLELRNHTENGKHSHGLQTVRPVQALVVKTHNRPVYFLLLYCTALHFNPTVYIIIFRANKPCK